MRPNPTAYLAAAFVATALFLSPHADAAYTPSHPPLAAGKTKFLGSAYSAAQATNFGAYFNQVTPENGGKWGSVEAAPDVMTWNDLDAAHTYATSNGFKFRFHVLVWGSQQPSWISALPTADKLKHIKEWFAAVATRYPNLDYVEVVNEPLHAPPNGETIAFSTTAAANYADALGGAGASGWEWVLQSFRLARQYFPGKKLVLNEYGVLNDASAMARYVQIINLLKAENLVDVVAVQAHSFELKGYQTATLSANLNTLVATGVPVMITEMDIDDTAAAPQLADYQRIFPLFWENPAVIGVTLWGYRPGLWRPEANLVEADGTEKPAMVWLKNYVRNTLPVVTAGQAFTLAPNTPNNTTIGVVQATDADAGAVLQNWSIVGGTGAAAFAIDASTGALRVTNSSALNFGTTPTYTVIVKVGDGFGYSEATSVSVTQSNAPTITTQPTNATANLGAAVSFTVVASNADSIKWQYSQDNASFADIGGAVAATYSIGSATYGASGYYRAVATNAHGSTTSNAVRLDVVPAAVAAVRTDGYGAAATGGGGNGSQALTVSTANELRAAATATGPRIISVSGTLDIGTLDLTSQKTIQGADANAALVGTLRIGNGVSNVVLRGLNLSSPAGDAVVINGGSNVFITRCSFLDAADHQLKITNGADLVTVSWCEFAASSAALAHRYSVQIGAPGAETKPLRVTLHHNWWTANIDQRMPLAVYGQVHLFNNYVAATANTSGAIADNQTQLFNEFNAFKGVNTPLTKQQTNTALAAGRILTIGTTYTDCTGTAPDAGTDTVFTPTYAYSMRAAADVAALVTAGAGNNNGVGYTEGTTGTAVISGPATAVNPGAALTLTATLTGGSATGYQWRRDNVALSGKTEATLTATMDAAQAGIYTVVVAQSSGDFAVSAPFTVTLGSGSTGGGSTGGGSTGGGSSGGGSSSGGGGGACGWLALAFGALLGARRMRCAKR